jgi:uncharacterized protein
MSNLEVHNQLKILQLNNPDIMAAAVIEAHGKLIESSFSENLSNSPLPKIGSELLNMSKEVLSLLNAGSFEEVLVHGHSHYIIFVASGQGLILMAITHSRAKLGLLFLDCKRTVNEIARLLD